MFGCFQLRPFAQPMTLAATELAFRAASVALLLVLATHTATALASIAMLSEDVAAKTKSPAA